MGIVGLSTIDYKHGLVYDSGMIKTKPPKKEQKYPMVRIYKHDYILVKEKAAERVTSIAQIITEALIEKYPTSSLYPPSH